MLAGGTQQDVPHVWSLVKPFISALVRCSLFGIVRCTHRTHTRISQGSSWGQGRRRGPVGALLVRRDAWVDSWRLERRGPFRALHANRKLLGVRTPTYTAAAQLLLSMRPLY